MAKKYNVTYSDVFGVTHTLEIFNDAFVGSSTDVNGRVWLQSAGVDSPMETIQGNSLRVQLEATEALDFSDLYSEEERVYSCVYSVAGSVVFRGWLNPEGWWESINSDVWRVEFDVVDGLGYLEDLAYVQDSGLNWTGRQTGLTVIVNALHRAGLEMDIYTNIGIGYVGLSTSVDVLANVYFNSERFYQEDDEPMGCLEVLKTTLEVFGAVIQQRDGAWFIYRPNQLAINTTQTFYHYDATGAAQTPATVAVDFADSIGSEGTGGFPNIYVNGNQRLTNKNSWGGYVINYKYGVAKSLIGNNKYLYTADGATYGDWTINSATNMTIPAAGGQSMTLNVVGVGLSILQMTSAGTITVNQDDLIEFRATIRQSVYPFTIQNSAKIQIKCVVGGTTYWADSGGVWRTSSRTLSFGFTGLETRSITVNPDPAPGTGNVSVEIYTPEVNTGPITGTHQWLLVELLNDNDEVGDVKGQIHTAQRTGAPAAKINKPVEVFVGDNYQDVYNGAIYKSDGVTNTDEWTRHKTAETKLLLQIACEDRLRMRQRVNKIFSGDSYGYFQPLTVLTLEGVSGSFMPVEYNYDTMFGVITITAHEIIDDEIADTTYKVTLDYGNTVKPKIKG